MRRVCLLWCALLWIGGLSSIAAGSASAVVEVETGRISFRWAAAAGPVASYGIWIAHKGEGFRTFPSGLSLEPSFSLLAVQYDTEFVLRVAAYDRDGKRGPFSATSEGIIFRAPGNGGGNGGPPPSGGGGGEPPERSSTRRDLDGDGRGDALFYSSSGKTLRAQLAAQSKSRSIKPKMGSQFVPEAGGDFDGDGREDLLLRQRSDGRVRVGLTRNLSALQYVDVGSLSTDWRSAGSADFDGDGDPDLLFWNARDGRVRVWRLDGTRRVATSNPSWVDPSFRLIGVGHFDEDDIADALWFDPKTGGMLFWYFDRKAGVRSAWDWVDPQRWEDGRVGDYDGNGLSDIVWTDRQGSDIGLWENDGVRATWSLQRISMGNGLSIEAVGDYDGNGREGLLARQLSSNQLIHIQLSRGKVSSLEGFGAGLPAGFEVVP